MGIEPIKFLNRISEILDTKDVYLVGGSVRDILLERESHDLDFATSLLPDDVEALLKKSGIKTYGIGKKFGTIAGQIDENDKKLNIEITTFRDESYDPQSRKPKTNYIDNLKKDLQRRDFTINSMAIDSTGKLYDYFGGKSDLNRKIIRTVENPKTSFEDDPLRMLRAARFAATLNFTIEDDTYIEISKNRFKLLLKVSKERWVKELDKMLLSEKPSIGLDILQNTHLMAMILPEIALQYNFDQDSPYHKHNLWEHTKRTVDLTPQTELELRWLALLHDVGKPFTKIKNNKGYSNYIGHELVGAEIALKICDYLKFSNIRKKYLYENIINHLDPLSPLRQYDNEAKD